ncbi:MAG: hypothetical protein J6B98_04415 [Bacilli bacterium]|nr:hypothetical protein [Bacilli bacterium]
MNEENESKLYYIICDISRICKNYFYERKYLPNDAWSIDDVVKRINNKTKELKKLYEVLKKNGDE